MTRLALAALLVLTIGQARATPADAVRLDPDGRFGAALDGRGLAVAAPSRQEYHAAPLTVELWAKLEGREGYNILVACARKESADHWELYTAPGSGHLAAYLPGTTPQTVDTGLDVADGRWHHVALALEADRARIAVDGRVVADVALARGVKASQPGPLWFGSYPPGGMTCAGLIDDVRLSRGARPVAPPPARPHEADAATVGLWTFDAMPLVDRSRLANPATPEAAQSAPPPPVAVAARPSGPGPVDYRPGDASLAVELIDRVEGESLLSVRGDAEGRLFVGGREGLFVYEPDGGEGYRPRRLITRFPAHSWVNDVAIRGDDLYVMTNAALYLLKGARTKPDGVVPERIVWGWPVDLHVTLHGLTWGLDGDLYFVAGDPLLNYGDFARRPDHWGHWTIHTRPEGTVVPYTGQGGVFRVRPDGSNLRVVARGLRGAFGIATDRRGEIFTCDNDHESLPAAYSPARLLHVVPGADFAWPRGWTADKGPDRADLLRTMMEGAGLGREVPVGMAYHDDPLLPEAYRDSLFLARWGQRRIDAFRLVPRGASFGVEERPLLIGRDTARPVGVTVGPGGEVLAVVCYMQNNEWSPAYVADLVRIRPKGADVTSGRWDPTRIDEVTLFQGLDSVSWNRRWEAYREILRRASSDPTMARRRTPRMWFGRELVDPTLAPLRALVGPEPATQVPAQVRDALRDPRVGEPGRLASLRLLLAQPEIAPSAELRAAVLAELANPSPLVAATALRVIDRFPGSLTDVEIEAIARGLARSADSYLRLPAVDLLARHLDLAALGGLTRDADPAVRLAGVLAAGRRLTIPPADFVPPDSLPLRYEAKNAEFVLTYADATVDLKRLGRVGSFTAAERWAAARTPEQEALAALLAERLESDRADAVVLQAAEFLHLLNDAALQPRVDRARQRVAADRLAKTPARRVDRTWRLGPIPADARGAGPIDLGATFAGPDGPIAWTEAPPELPARRSDGDVIDLYTRLQAPAATTARLDAGPPAPLAVWVNGRPARLPELSLQAGGNELVVRVAAPAGPATLAMTLHAPAAVAVTLPERLGLATLAERLKAAGTDGDAVPAAFAAVDWGRAPAEGDFERGRKLFSADALGCARCHAIRPDDPTTGGPSLAGARDRFTVAHVVESVLLPGRQVAPAFRATTLATESGEVLTGLVTAENAAEFELLLPDATRRTVKVAEVAERRQAEVSPMPAGLVRTPEELRDLLAYLLGTTP
jgi:putative heme-binding domain-containing protein